MAVCAPVAASFNPVSPQRSWFQPGFQDASLRHAHLNGTQTITAQDLFLSPLSTYLPTYLPTYLSTYLFVCLSVHLSIYLSRSIIKDPIEVPHGAHGFEPPSIAPCQICHSATILMGGFGRNCAGSLFFFLTSSSNCMMTAECVFTHQAKGTRAHVTNNRRLEP